MPHINNPTEKTSVLANLRAILPNRQLRLDEALRLAELQANRLLTLQGANDSPVSGEIVTELPGIAVDYDIDMPASGSSDWDSRHRQWVITLRASEPDTRHRFTLLHEYKHIIDHGSPGIVANRDGLTTGRPAAETVADYFAACVLMPKRLIKAAYFGGKQTVETLADLFEVSDAAMRVRLEQLGLTRAVDADPHATARWQTPSALARHGRYQRASSQNWTGLTPTEAAT